MRLADFVCRRTLRSTRFFEKVLPHLVPGDMYR